MICAGCRVKRGVRPLRLWRSSSTLTLSGSILTMLRCVSGVLQNHRARLAELRSTLRQDAVREVRKYLRRDTRREPTAKLRMVKGQQSDRLLAGYLERGEETLEMQLPGGPSGNRPAGRLEHMVRGFTVLMTMTLLLNFNVWSVFGNWHSV